MSVTTKTSINYGALDEMDNFDGNDNPTPDPNPAAKAQKIGNIKDQLFKGVNVDIHADLSEKEENIRNRQEKFDKRTEEAFAWLQVLTACFAILAHGSNDIANSVAPFAGI